MNPDNLNIGSVENHRTGREGGAMVYPVCSRRSGGLSIGINLFPDKKVCSFDCPYCEVFPFETGIHFSPDTMEKALKETIEHARIQNIPIRDICFSGNGEPTMSPYFEEALNRAAVIRKTQAAEARLVVISNGTTLLDDGMFNFLVSAAAGPEALDIWLKVDAGTDDWYRVIDCSRVPFQILKDKMKQFAAQAPFIIQTMICSIDGKAPPEGEASAWINLVTELAIIAGNAYGIKNIQIYGKARPAPKDPHARALPEEILQSRADDLRTALRMTGLDIPVEVYP